MIHLIEALNFRCLRDISQPLKPFHVLVGPNASGKTTFLDVVAFLGRLVSDSPEAAVSERTSNFQDLVWKRSGDSFELAIEARIPDHLKRNNGENGFDIIRYEVSIGIDQDTREISIFAERVLLKNYQPSPDIERTFFPMESQSRSTLLSPKKKGVKTIASKIRGGNDNYRSEVHEKSSQGWIPAFKLGPRKSTLGNLPEDESRFPVSTWLKNLLIEGIQNVVLNSLSLRKASPPGQSRIFLPDGSNLPWVIDRLYRESPERFRDWISHLQTALPDIDTIRTIEREDDKHRYLVIRYLGGLEVPSWTTSDGTLRLLALTLPAYLPGLKGVYLIEEPENGIHPRAVEAMFQSLSSVYDAQVLLASHSPVVLGLAKPDQVLCFAKTEEGATDIVLGSEHPSLKKWRGETNLGDLFASGVLG